MESFPFREAPLQEKYAQLNTGPYQMTEGWALSPEISPNDLEAHTFKNKWQRFKKYENYNHNCHLMNKSTRIQISDFSSIQRNNFTKRDFSRYKYGLAQSQVRQSLGFYNMKTSTNLQKVMIKLNSHLHKALLGKNIDTYIDNRLEKGDDIGPTLLEAIEKSKIALVIFSKDYASSTWCLKELVNILECKKSYGQILIPIFYHRPPKHTRDKVANWKASLEEASNMSGFPYSSKTKYTKSLTCINSYFLSFDSYLLLSVFQTIFARRTEADFVEEVVQDILTKLNRKLSRN
ncbi:hypothetical protein PRUPE_2G083100 [Prunus persica]|uniref:Uncharacterized protein n=1 Tax=Prunus persica TaxID=3760 RepID=M5XAW0_PRUPE|nr:hypothetical protein PRUPE_2G083100 [Prunus persica]